MKLGERGAMNSKEWHSTMAPIWLAAAVPVEPDQSVIHIGSGAGHACFSLARRLPAQRIHGIEWNRDSVRQAAEHARDQQWQGRVEILHSDGLNPPPRLAAGTFDHAIMLWDGDVEPPFANQMRMMLMMLRPQGILTLLIEPTWLTHVLQIWGERVGCTHIFPLWFQENNTADYIIVQAQKSAHSSLTLQRGMVVTQANGQLTQKAEAITHHNAQLFVT